MSSPGLLDVLKNNLLLDFFITGFVFPVNASFLKQKMKAFFSYFQAKYVWPFQSNLAFSTTKVSSLTLNVLNRDPERVRSTR